MRAVLLGLLGHQPNIGDVASGCPVKLAIGLAVLDDCVVDGGVGPVGDHTLYLEEGDVLK